MQVAALQADDDRVSYVRVIVGESFTPCELSRVMAARGLGHGDPHRRNVFHLDLGHVPPADCNTFLFQLLLEGCVRRVDKSA